MPLTRCDDESRREDSDSPSVVEGVQDTDELGDFAELLDRLRAGDVSAIGQLYDRYLDRSIRHAKSQLFDGEQPLIDEEQAVLSALESLVVRVRGGNYADVNDQLQLWKLLATIISRKVTKYRRWMRMKKRYPGTPVLAVSDHTGDSSNDGRPAVDNQPSPLAVAIANETLQQILGALRDPDARNVLLLRLEGYSDVEIADRLCHSRNWVWRRGMAIRRVGKSLLM